MAPLPRPAQSRPCHMTPADRKGGSHVTNRDCSTRVRAGLGPGQRTALVSAPAAAGGPTGGTQRAVLVVPGWWRTCRGGRTRSRRASGSRTGRWLTRNRWNVPGSGCQPPAPQQRLDGADPGAAVAADRRDENYSRACELAGPDLCQHGLLCREVLPAHPSLQETNDADVSDLPPACDNSAGDVADGGLVPGSRRRHGRRPGRIPGLAATRRVTPAPASSAVAGNVRPVSRDARGSMSAVGRRHRGTWLPDLASAPRP